MSEERVEVGQIWRWVGATPGGDYTIKVEKVDGDEAVVRNVADESRRIHAGLLREAFELVEPPGGRQR
jgi:hypothetical protein